MEQALAIPLPATTQWDVVAQAAPSVVPAVEELARQAAQGTVRHNDDTTARILTFTAEALPPGAKRERSGVFTSGVVAETVNGPIALFKTGPCHAGEHLAAILDHREDPTPLAREIFRENSRDGRLADTAFVLDNCYHLHDAPPLKAIP